MKIGIRHFFGFKMNRLYTKKKKVKVVLWTKMKNKRENFRKRHILFRFVHSKELEKNVQCEQEKR